MAEEVGCGTKTGNFFGRRFTPFAFYPIFFRSGTPSILYSIKAERTFRMSGNNIWLRTEYRLPAKSFHRHFHVRLSRTEPYLANQNVFQHEFFSIRKSDCVRASCLGGRQNQFPSSVLIADSRNLTVIPGGGYIHTFSGRRLSVKGYLRLLLQYHVIAPNGGQRYLRFRLQKEQRTYQ